MARFILDGEQFYTTLIQPQFNDGLPDARAFRGVLNEFSVMDNVQTRKPIIHFQNNQNIMQRRDASCDIIYKKLFGANTTFLSVDEFYGATKFCANEFYQGDLKEFRNNDDQFFPKIEPFFRKAINTDLTTNAYFGDVSRVTSPAAKYSTNIIDGIWTWIKKYRQSNLIPANQTFTIGDNKNSYTTPQDAYTLVQQMYEARPPLMKIFVPDEQEYYLSPEIIEGYQKYMLASGLGNTAYINDIVTGREVAAYMGIPMRAERMWTPVLTELKGGPAYGAVLTIRGNFFFGIDRGYGEGPNRNTAFEVWYDIDSMTWKWRFFMRAGTNIAAPEHIVYGITNF